MAHDSNVSICNHNKSSFLEFNTRSMDEEEERISIDDIYMFIDKHTKISFLQKSTNQILSFGTTNKYITVAFPKILKFLVEVSNCQKPTMESFLFLIKRLSNNFNGYTPKIKYKDFEIIPETWRIDKREIIKNNRFIEFEKFESLITKLTDENKLPYEIYTGSVDRKLVLNLNYSVDRRLLYELLKKDNNLLLHKNNFSSSNLLIFNKENEKFIGEFVFQFESKQLSNDLYPYSRNRIPLITNAEILDYSFLPFENWVTLQIYLDSQNENIVLINQINEMYKYLIENNIIDKFFFIRYKDPFNHLRLRFRICKGMKSELLNKCDHLLTILKEYKILNNASYSSYVPEINRYGGEENMKIAEDLFCYNSIQTIDMLSLIKNNKFKMNIKQLFLISCYRIIKDMEINDEEIIFYLKRYKLNKNFNTTFNKLVENIKEYFYSDGSYEFFRKNNIVEIFEILEFTKTLNQKYWRNICETTKNQNDLDERIRKRYVVISVLHMFHNRLIGVDRENEDFLM